MNQLTELVAKVSGWIWGLPMLVILVGAGIIMSVTLNFFQFRHLPFILKQTFGKIFAKSEGDGTISPFQAATSALASTVGASNIIGVPVAISMGGWSDAIGEDIVLTWKMFSKGYKVYYEPLAIAYTEVPISLKHFYRQRSRWARGMIEAIKEVKPWSTPRFFSKYLTGIDLVIPYLDLSYTLFWIPGLIFAFLGYYYIVGLITLLVLPLSLFTFYIEYSYKKNYVFKELGLKFRNNKVGFILFVLFYQILMSPISIIGYIQEALGLGRKWK